MSVVTPAWGGLRSDTLTVSPVTATQGQDWVESAVAGGLVARPAADGRLVCQTADRARAEVSLQVTGTPAHLSGVARRGREYTSLAVHL